MGKFGSKSKTTQEIPTSALPDIIFMLLFFFMVTTVMREVTLLVKNGLPNASQIQKLEKKNLVTYIYVGEPKDVERFGEAPRIQLNDALATPDEIPQFIFEEKAKLAEADREKITVSLKIDRDAKMGIVSDVRQQLREANALKVNYASTPGKATE